MKNLFDIVLRKSVNIISSIMVFGVSIMINLFLSPIIINNLGAEMHGYATLANNVAYYFSLIGLAVNSMGVRFVTIAWHGGKKEEARKYYSTILFFDIILACIILLCGIIVSLKLEYLFNVSTNYLIQTKIAFICAFMASAISTVIPVLNSGAYINNSIRSIYFYTILSQIIRLFVVLLLFHIDIKIYYVTISSVISNLLQGALLAFYNKKRVAELKFTIRGISIDCLKAVAKSGIWSMGDTVSSVLISGLNLVYANLMIGEIGMGLLSVATIIPSQFLSLSQYVAQCYMPGMLESFSQNKPKQLENYVLKAQKMTGIILITPIAGFIIFGDSFFRLWLPMRTNQEILIIQKLATILLLPYIICSTTQSCRQINVVYNKIKLPTVISLMIGLLELILIFIAGKVGKLTIFMLAVVTAVALVVKEISANFIYAVMISKIRAKQFLLRMLLIFVLFLIVFFIYSTINSAINITNWAGFFRTIILCGGIGYIVSFGLCRKWIHDT